MTERTKYLGTKADKDKTYLDWNYDARTKRLFVALHFFHTTPSVNEMRILALQEKKQEIHTAFGKDLDWDYKQGRSEQYIRSYTQVGSLKDEDKWSEIQGDPVNRLIRLERVMRDYIAALE